MNVNVTFDIYLATRKTDFATLQIRKVRKVCGEERGETRDGEKGKRRRDIRKGEGNRKEREREQRGEG